MNGLEFLLNSLGGATAGYFTNYFAVKMLFRKYGPFGGYILKTKEEFFENTSSLVEDKIINHHTIEEELEQGEFEEVFRKAVFDILDKHIYHYVGDEKWIDIPDMSDSLTNLKKYLSDKTPDYTEQILHKPLTEIKINDILGKEQVRILTHNMFELLLEIMHDSNILKEFVLDFVRENGDKKISSFFTEEMWDKLQEIEFPETNLSDLVEENYDHHINLVLNNIFEMIKLPISDLEDSLLDKTLGDLFGYENLERLIDNLISGLYDLLESREGNELIEQVLEDIFASIKKIDVPIFSLFSQELQQRLDNFMRQVFPSLVKEGLKWLQKNEDELEYLIEKSLDDVLESGSGFKNVIKKGLYNILKGDNRGSLSIVNKIISRVETEEDNIEKISEELTNSLITYLKTHHVGQIMSTLERKGVINPVQIRKLLMKRLEGWRDKLQLSFIEELYSARIGSLLELDLQSFFKELKQGLIKQIRELIYSDRFEELLNSRIKAFVKKMGERKLADLLEMSIIDDNFDQFKDILLNYLEDKKDGFIDQLNRDINQLIEDRYLGDILNEDLKLQLNISLERVLLTNLESLIDNFSKQPITYRLDNIDKEELSRGLADLLLDLVNNNLSQILQGRIQRTVANSLGKLDDNDIQDTVEDFMGTELKPITWLGAGLGGLVGVFLYSITMAYDLSLPLSTGLGLSSLTYGFIGFLTNVVALRMIFRPYDKKRILGLPLPFTPGVVAKNKPRFANSMGDFVNSELLKATTVSEIFTEKRDQLEEGFTETIAEDDYRLVYQGLIENSQFLADRLYGAGIYYLRHNEDQAAAFLIEKFNEMDLSKRDLNSISDSVMDKVKKYLDNPPPFIVEKIVRGFNNNRNIQEILPKGSMALIGDWLEGYISNQIIGLSHFLENESNFRDLIINYEDRFQEIKSRKLEDLIPPPWQNKLRTTLSDYIISKLDSEEFRDKTSSILIKRFSDILFGSKEGLIDYIYSGLTNWLQNEGREVLKKETLTIIENELREKSNESVINTLTMGFYHFTDTEETVRKVIDDLVDKKIPYFLDSKKESLHFLINDFIDSLVADGMDKLGEEIILEGTESVRWGLRQKSNWQNILSNSIKTLVSDLFQVRLGTLLNFLAIDSLYDFYQRFEDEIDIFRRSIVETLANLNQKLAQEIKPICVEIMEEIMGKVSLDEIFSGLTEDDLRTISTGLIKDIGSSQALEEDLNSFLKMAQKRLVEKKPEEFLDLRSLRDNLSNTLSNILYQREIRDYYKALIQVGIDDFAGDLSKIVEPETRDYLLRVALGSSLDSLEDNMIDIINSLNLEEITRREINEMDPAEIEYLFYSFAGRYMTRLKLYGWLGGGFGIMARLLSLLS